MLSKNNWKEQYRKQTSKKQRFAIKKLTVGVASVLVGFTFMGINASADTTEATGVKPTDTNTEVSVNNNAEPDSQVILKNGQSDEQAAGQSGTSNGVRVT